MRAGLMISLVIGLAGCGAIGTPVVVEETTAVGEVDIVPMTAASIQTANKTTYRPRTLPAIFSRTTGTPASIRGLGTLPDPSYDPSNRPGPLETRMPPAHTQTKYEIGVGDVLVLATRANSTSVEQLSNLLSVQTGRQGYTVQDDGAIAIPDVGRIQLAGKTIQEAEETLFSALVNAQIDPSFSLEVAEFNSQRVSIGGAVRKPSLVPITLKPLHLEEALAGVGGIDAEDLTYASIRIYRDEQIYQLPVETYMTSPAMKTITLRDGDSVYVDVSYDLDRASAYFQQQITLQTTRFNARATALDALETEVTLRRAELEEARSNFENKVTFDAIERDYVYIAGEVGSQGRFTLPFERSASLADALFSEASGIPNATGNISEVYVLRGTGDGRGIQAWHLNAENAANLVLATRFELRPNDVIFVSEKPLTALSRVLGQVAASVALLVP